MQGEKNRKVEALGRRDYPADASGYELTEQIGQGTAGSVFRAWCKQVNEEVAVKVVDLEWFQASLDDIWKEIKVMSLSSHPNVVPYSTSFVHGHDLWVVMPLLTGGSVLSLLNCLFPDGLPEPLTKYILFETLKALDYFHRHGQMHRDVKAANILLNAQGQVMLSDYGVMGWMVEGGMERKQRQTFVGTPCWMAPEVMEQKHGYDYKADIWSFGITAIELAQGRAPYVNYPPMKVLLMILNNEPPRLDEAVDAKYSKAFKEMVQLCLRKDPKHRFDAAHLLNHRFFRNVKKPDTLVDLLKTLPPLGSRGGSQVNLYRHLQRINQGTSHHFERSSNAFSWDFETNDVVEEKKEASSTVTDSVNAQAPSKALDIADENLDEEQKVVAASIDVVPAVSIADTPSTDVTTIDGVPLSDLTEGKSFADESNSEPPTPTLNENAQGNAGVGKLRKGRFTVSEVELTKDMNTTEVDPTTMIRANYSESALDSTDTTSKKSRFAVTELDEIKQAGKTAVTKFGGSDATNGFTTDPIPVVVPVPSSAAKVDLEKSETATIESSTSTASQLALSRVPTPAQKLDEETEQPVQSTKVGRFQVKDVNKITESAPNLPSGQPLPTDASQAREIASPPGETKLTNQAAPVPVVPSTATDGVSPVEKEAVTQRRKAKSRFLVKETIEVVGPAGERSKDITDNKEQTKEAVETSTTVKVGRFEVKNTEKVSAAATTNTNTPAASNSPAERRRIEVIDSADAEQRLNGGLTSQKSLPIGGVIPPVTADATRKFRVTDVTQAEGSSGSIRMGRFEVSDTIRDTDPIFDDAEPQLAQTSPAKDAQNSLEMKDARSPLDLLRSLTNMVEKLVIENDALRKEVAALKRDTLNKQIRPVDIAP